MVRRVICAVPDGVGWRVRECGRTPFGWRLGREDGLAGEAVGDLLRQIHRDPRREAVVAIGLGRARLVVRVVPRGSSVAEAFPRGIELAVWMRAVVEGGQPATEVIACPRDTASRVLDEVRAAGFAGAFLFPVWAVADRGAGRVRPGTLVMWQGGRIVAAGGGFGPWIDGDVEDGSAVSGVAASLKGGLSYALSGVPDGWSCGILPRRPSALLPVAVLVTASMVWGGIRGQWIEHRIATAESQRDELVALLRDRAGGCTIGDVAAVLKAASLETDIRLDRVQFSGEGLTFVGSAPRLALAQALAERLNADPTRSAIVSMGSTASFRLEVTLQCDH